MLNLKVILLLGYKVVVKVIRPTVILLLLASSRNEQLTTDMQTNSKDELMVNPSSMLAAAVRPTCARAKTDQNCKQ